MGNAEQAATINFPESRRVLGHVNHTILGSTVDYPSDSSASCNFWHLSNLNTVINQHYQKLHTVQWCFHCNVYNGNIMYDEPISKTQSQATVFLRFSLYSIVFIHIKSLIKIQVSAVLKINDKILALFVCFYQCDAMLARVIAIATCPSVCLSVRHTPVLCQNKES